MCGGVEMENAAPIMLDYEEAVQHTETQRRHGEEVEGGDHLAVVLEECPPSAAPSTGQAGASAVAESSMR
jgi:hypothetical protein